MFRSSISHKSAPLSALQHRSAVATRAATVSAIRRCRVWRGLFVDVHTFATALLSRSFTLATLSQFLGVETRKHDSDEHGKTLTEKYLKYAGRRRASDVAVLSGTYTPLRAAPPRGDTPATDLQRGWYWQGLLERYERQGMARLANSPTRAARDHPQQLLRRTE